MTEHRVRAMRDVIYGPCSDHNWNECKSNCLREDSVEWLKNECAKASQLNVTDIVRKKK